MLLNRSEMDDAMHLVNGAKADLLHAQDFDPRSKGWNRWSGEALKKLLEAAELMAGHNQAPDRTTPTMPNPWDLSLQPVRMEPVRMEPDYNPWRDGPTPDGQD